MINAIFLGLFISLSLLGMVATLVITRVHLLENHVRRLERESIPDESDQVSPQKDWL